MPVTGNASETKEDKMPLVADENKTDTSGCGAGKLSTKNKPNSPIAKPTLKIREHWGQEKGQIVFTMYQKKLVKEDVSVECTTDTLSVLLSLPDGSEYARNIQLVDKIQPSEIKWTVNPYKVQIFARKENPLKVWKTYEQNEEERRKENIIFNRWSTEKEKAVNEQYEIAEKEDEKANALDGLFKKIYKDATPETRRAMIKSYQTSKGTVLSTNWDEVKEKDYEGKDKVVPKGYEDDDD